MSTTSATSLWPQALDRLRAGTLRASRQQSARDRAARAVIAMVLISTLILIAGGHASGSEILVRNGLVAFSTGKQIMVVRPDGTRARRITDTRLHNRSPAWAPHGGWLAFSCRGTRTLDRDICLARPDGSQRRYLTRDDIPDQTPASSPDGRKLAFSRDTGFGSQIFVINRDGTKLRQVTSNAVSAFAPEWSPDGERILFVGWGVGSTDIFSIRADGSGETNLTQSPETEARAGWSPDAGSIVFDRLIEGEGYQLFTAAADGTRQRALNVPGFGPSWSPNGRRIVATALTGSHLRCFSIRTDGTGLQHVSPAGVDCYSPDWQPRR